MTIAGTRKANPFRPDPADAWAEAFDFCRALDRPIYAEIEATLWNLFPSGRADRIEKEEETIFHRRVKLRRRRGSQFYRDRSERAAATVCGAPVTEYDTRFEGNGGGWIRQVDGQRFSACRACWPDQKDFRSNPTPNRKETS